MKSKVRGAFNRILHSIARQAPGATTLRPFLHRLRGVKIGKNVFIGDEVYLENEYPESIEIGDGAQISVRTIVIAHTRGAGKVIIGKSVFVGPNSVITCPGTRAVQIGEGSVIGAGSVISRDIPARVLVSNDAPKILAKVNLPLSEAESFEAFVRGLAPIKRPAKPAPAKPAAPTQS